MLLSVFDTIVGFISQSGSSIGLPTIAVIGLGALLLTVLIALITSFFSIEMKTSRAVEKINDYLEINPFVNDENIVEFNRLMKKIPRPMRYQWQKYMVNRTEKPSSFLNEENCINKPFRTSGYVQTMALVKYILISVSVLVFTFSLGALYTGSDKIGYVLLRSGIVPFIICFVGALFLMYLKARRGALMGDLYYNFSTMQKYIDRAVTTFPEFVDYEILFTRKEIVGGIPALQEYLQQRAVYEQEQLEKAKASQVEHEKYDFSKLGVNGSLVMEKSMKECEFYLGNRKMILADIDQLQSERDMLNRNYDEKNKVSQRKLRDIKETIDRLREKLNATTNKIVGNDLRKQMGDEAKKQQLVEKESDEDNNRYNGELTKLNVQIEAKRAEIGKNRDLVEKTLNIEFKAFSDKIYEEMRALVDEQVKSEIENFNKEKQYLQEQLEAREKYIAEKDALYDEKVAIIEQYSQELENQQNQVSECQSNTDTIANLVEEKESHIQEKEEEISSLTQKINELNSLVANLQSDNETKVQQISELKNTTTKEVYRYFDANGNEFFYDNAGNPFYYDENGKLAYYDSALQEEYNEEHAPKENVEEPLIEEKVEEAESAPVAESETEEPVEEKPVEEEPVSEDETEKTSKKKKSQKTTKSKKSKKIEAPVEEKPVLEEQKVKEEPAKQTDLSDNLDFDFGAFEDALNEVDKDKK